MKNKKLISVLIVIGIIVLIGGVILVINYKKTQQEKIKTSYSLVSPNGGEQIKIGSSYEIKWDPSLLGNSNNVEISLSDDSLKCSPKELGCWNAHGIAIVKNTGSYVWDTSKYLFGDAGPHSIKVRPGSSYKISINDAGPNSVETTPGDPYRVSTPANLITLESKNTFSITQ